MIGGRDNEMPAVLDSINQDLLNALPDTVGAVAYQGGRIGVHASAATAAMANIAHKQEDFQAPTKC